MVALNALFDIIAAGFENTLSLDGTTPNSMQADIDLNSNDLLNVYSIFAQFFKDSEGNLISLADINTLGAIVGDLELLADIEDGTIATGAITTVASIAPEVVIVAGIANDVVTVSSISADVTAVAADAVDIGIVAADLVGADTIGTVAGIAAEVVTVAGIAGNVTTVAGISADVTTVAATTPDIASVLGIAGDITTVAGVSADVTLVANNTASIVNLSDAVTNGDLLNDVYQGAFAADPTLRLDLSALQTGDLYFNTGTSLLQVYTGSTWLDGVAAAGISAATTIDVTASASAGSFPLIFHEAAAGAALALTSSTGITVNASTSTLSVNGDVIAYAASDRRLKTNIKPISGAVDKVKQLSGNTYDWLENSDLHDFTGSDVGVIAQEVEAVFPELVSTRPNGYKAVRYDKLVAVLIEAVKELSAEVDSLKGNK